MNPWDHHSALERDRLITIAKLLERGRNDALDRFDPTIGSIGWTVGCDAFAFAKHQIETAAAEIDWLEILDPSMHFIFSIGGVPVRFYRGDPVEPNARTLKQSFSELHELSLFGSDELVSLAPEPMYRFAIETDIDGAITQISFVVLDGVAPVLTWPVPLGEPVTRISPLWIPGSDGVDLPAPAVGIATRKRKDGTTE